MSFTYTGQKVPRDYRCTTCGLRGYKLWRPYQTFHIELFCADCVEARAKAKLAPAALATIGWYVAAVPTVDATGYWGYTSVPMEGILWWNGLETRAPAGYRPTVSFWEPAYEAAERGVKQLKQRYRDWRQAPTRWVPQGDDADVFKDVVYLVEANSNEQHELWYQWYHEPRYGTKVDWEQVYRGVAVTIGTVDKRPVVVSVTYALIEGQRVMFYYGCSQVVDHQMIDDWMTHYAKGVPRRDAQNFGHCIQNIRKEKAA
jgi:hypothetical protein